MKHYKYMVYIVILSVICFYTNIIAQEHPTNKKRGEHPTSIEHPKSVEHPSNPPEHPANKKIKKGIKKYLLKAKHEHPVKKEKSGLTIKEFANAVEHYVAKQVKKSGGYFLVNDSKQKKVLKCKLEKIHKKRLATLGNNEYFVCADFKADDGNTYDIDIFMQGTSEENLKATRTLVHKDNGTPRYTWFEENGIWKTKEYQKK